MTIPWFWLAAIVLFALLGVTVVIIKIVDGTKTIIGIIKDLAAVLHEAVDTAKEFRADFAFVRQVAQSTPNFGVQPESVPQQAAEEPEPIRFPPSYIDRFPQKPVEEDAPLEAAKDIDVTPSEEEVAEQAKVEELLSMGIKVHPEDQ
jgi:hypothetical protein